MYVTNNVDRSLWEQMRSTVVLTAIGCVCVAGLMILNTNVRVSAAPEPTTVASDTPGPATIAEWRFRTSGAMAGVFSIAETFKKSPSKESCMVLAYGIAEAMNTTGPAPDEMLQKHFTDMMHEYKSAADKCVAGDQAGSLAALQSAEKERQTIGVSR